MYIIYMKYNLHCHEQFGISFVFDRLCHLNVLQCQLSFHEALQN